MHALVWLNDSTVRLQRKKRKRQMREGMVPGALRKQRRLHRFEVRADGALEAGGGVEEGAGHGVADGVQVHLRGRKEE
eukprot:1062019-Rhodomonas_salina.1